MGINNWKADERPRERMYEFGASSLSDTELLAILINSGTKDKSAVEVARTLLASAGNTIGGVAGLSLTELSGISGIGPAKAARLSAAFELSKRAASDSHSSSHSAITTSRKVYEIFKPLLSGLKHEECWVLYLNRGNRIIARERLSIGGTHSTVMEPKFIIKKAVDRLACSIILVHNHPSGNPVPSEADKLQTKALKEAADLLDIALLDHIIVAGETYYSFCDSST